MFASRTFGMIFILFMLCLYSVQVDSKVIDSSVVLSSDVCDVYLGKFSFSPTKQGQFASVFKADLTPNSPLQFRGRSMSVSLFRDEGWSNYLTLLKSGSLCQERMRHAFFTFHVSQLGQPYDPRDMMRTSTPVRGNDGGSKFGYFVQTLVPPQPHSHYVFAVLHDCMLENYKAEPVTYKYTAVFLNDGSHLPADEDGMILMHTCLAVLLVGFLGYVLYLMQRQRRDFTSVHLVSVLCALALLLQIVAVVSSLAHLAVYSQDGLGLRFRHTYFALDFVSKIAQSSSELIVAFVFLCLAAGWTLTDSFSMKRLISNPLSAFAVFSIFTLTFVMEIMGRRFEDDFNQFHAHEHWPGTVLMSLRIFLALVFVATAADVYGILLPRRIAHWLSPLVFSSELTLLQWIIRLNNLGSGSSTSTPARASLPPGANAAAAERSNVSSSVNAETEALNRGSTPEKAAFVELEVASLMKRVATVALIWFLTFPIAGLAISPLLAPSSRHPFVTWASLIAQSLALCYLFNAFLNPNSRAFKASSLRNMGTVFNVGGEAELGTGWLSRWLKASID